MRNSEQTKKIELALEYNEDVDSKTEVEISNEDNRLIFEIWEDIEKGAVNTPKQTDYEETPVHPNFGEIDEDGNFRPY